jgi:hypothetical protein
MIVHSESITERALMVWDGGASNPRALTRLLVLIADEAADSEGSAGVARSAEFRLVLAQLFHVLYRSDPYSIYYYDAPGRVSPSKHDPFEDTEFLRKKKIASYHELLQMMEEAKKAGK